MLVESSGGNAEERDQHSRYDRATAPTEGDAEILCVRASDGLRLLAEPVTAGRFRLHPRRLQTPD